MEDKQEPQVFEQLWVYIGRRLNNSSIMYTWALLDENGKVSELSHYWYKKNITRLASLPGQVFKIRGVDHDVKRVYIKGKYSPEYVSMYPESEERLQWQISDKDAALADRINKERKQDMSSDEIRDCLAPIKEAMAKVSYTGKQRIIAIVIETLMR